MTENLHTKESLPTSLKSLSHNMPFPIIDPGNRTLYQQVSSTSTLDDSQHHSDDLLPIMMIGCLCR